VNWIELAQDRDRWHALVNTVMRGISLLAENRILDHGVSK